MKFLMFKYVSNLFKQTKKGRDEENRSNCPYLNKFSEKRENGMESGISCIKNSQGFLHPFDVYYHAFTQTGIL